jgi:hypothetical protein
MHRDQNHKLMKPKIWASEDKDAVIWRESLLHFFIRRLSAGLNCLRFDVLVGDSSLTFCSSKIRVGADNVEMTH